MLMSPQHRPEIAEGYASDITERLHITTAKEVSSDAVVTRLSRIEKGEATRELLYLVNSDKVTPEDAYRIADALDLIEQRKNVAD